MPCVVQPLSWQSCFSAYFAVLCCVLQVLSPFVGLDYMKFVVKLSALSCHTQVLIDFCL